MVVMLSVEVRTQLTIAVWIAALIIPFVPTRISASTNFTYNTQVIYKVQADNLTEVTEHYTITNNTPRLYLSELKLITPTAGISGLKAGYDGGETIPATAARQSSSKGDLDFASSEIQIKFPRPVFGEGRKWGFTVSYKAKGLADSRGGSHTVFIPSIDPNEGTASYNVRVEVPASFGSPHFTGAKAASSGTSNDSQYFTFEGSELVKHSLALAFGDVNRYKLNFNFPLHNNSPFPRTLTVALPPDLNNQKVSINGLKPAPSNTRLDEDGNVLADYKLGPGQKINVTTDVVGEVKHKNYDLTKSGFKKDIPFKLAKQYTGATRYWPTGGAVGAEAAKLSDDNRPVITNVKAMYDFVIAKLDYNNDKIKFNIRQGADKALANPSNAVCLEYTDLLVAMLRSQGIPARMPVGYGYSGNLKKSDAVADSLHSWVEAYVPGIGWMTLDPTWGEKFDEFGKSDLEHFAFSVWGRNDELPAAVMAGNRDENYQYEKAVLTYVPTMAPSPANAAKLSIVRHVLFPGLSWDTIEVIAPGGGVTENNLVSYRQAQLPFGSLAPVQKASQGRLVLGGQWKSIEEAKLIRPADGKILVLAQTRNTVNFIPLVSVCVSFVLLILVVLVIRRRRLDY